MSYKISGDLDKSADIVIIDQNTWAIELAIIDNPDDYTIVSGISTGEKIVFGRDRSTGQIIAYGGVRPLWDSVALTGDLGIFGGFTSEELFTYSMDYINIPTAGNSSEFGDLTLPRAWVESASNGANNRGVWAGGDVTGQRNIIDYVSLSSTGLANDFGDLILPMNNKAGISNKTNNRGIFGGGWSYTYPTHYTYNTIDYITISTTGNAQDFGDLGTAKGEMATVSNGTLNRGVFSGGSTGDSVSGVVNTIEYVTISSAGNASDFGDLLAAVYRHAGIDNGTNDRGVFAAGTVGESSFSNNIEYITISTTGNSTDFGDIEWTGIQFADGVSNGTGNVGIFSFCEDNSAVGWYERISINSLGNSIYEEYGTSHNITPDFSSGVANA